MLLREFRYSSNSQPSKQELEFEILAKLNLTSSDARCLRLSAILCVTVWLSFLPTTCHAESDDDFFEARVRPLLIKHCQDCHGAKKQEGGLRLDSRDAWMRGGDRGATIIAGEPDNSLLIQAVRHDDPDLQMPPNAKKLTATEIADLETWVQRGASDPRRESDTETSNRLSLEQSQSHWSFQPLQAVVPSQDIEDRWSRNPIDAFIHAQLTEQELSPVADADRRTLIRRATFDLTGLPPTPAEIDAFLSDESADILALHGPPEKYADRVIATGFLAIGKRYGYKDAPDYQYLDFGDVIDSVGRSLLGLTLGCACRKSDEMKL